MKQSSYVDYVAKEPSDTKRHLPQPVNKCKTLFPGTVKRVASQFRDVPLDLHRGAAMGFGTKAAFFHPSFWLTGPLARGVRIRGLYLGHSQPVDQFPQAQRNQP